MGFAYTYSCLLLGQHFRFGERDDIPSDWIGCRDDGKPCHTCEDLSSHLDVGTRLGVLSTILVGKYSDYLPPVSPDELVISVWTQMCLKTEWGFVNFHPLRTLMLIGT